MKVFKRRPSFLLLASVALIILTILEISTSGHALSEHRNLLWMLPITATIVTCLLYIRMATFFLLVPSLIAHALVVAQNPVSIFDEMIVALLIAIFGHILTPNITSLYMIAGLRWWEPKRRFRTDLLCSYYIGDDDNKIYEGVIENLSLTGAFLVGGSELEDEEEITICLSHRSLNTKIQARVVHSKRRGGILGHGVEFMLSPWVFNQKLRQILIDENQKIG